MGYPTEGVFGLGCLAFDDAAVRRLVALKRRSSAKGLILLYADAADVQALLAPLPASRRAAVLSSWPGPVTWLIPAPRIVPTLLRGGSDRIAVRVTAHPVARALCGELRREVRRQAPRRGARGLLGAAERLGAGLVSTSANLSGSPALRSSAEVSRAFGDSLATVLPGRLPPSGEPTAVVDALTGHVLRPSAAWPPQD